MSRNKIADKTIADDLTGVTITFADRSTLTVSLASLSPDIVTHLALHGLSQKLGDSYSGEPSVEVARGKAEAVANRLTAGEWRAVAAGEGSGRITDLAQALANITGRTVTEAVAAIENMDKDQKGKLRKHPEIAVEVKRLSLERAQKAASGSDSESLASLLG